MKSGQVGPGLVVFFTVLGLMAAARLAELFIARRHSLEAALRAERPEPEPAFAGMVLLHTLPFWMAPLEVFRFERPFIPALAAVSIAVLAVAAGLRVWTLTTLGSMWNVRIVRPAQVITTGPYRYVRHPNYAVIILELFFLPLVHTAVLTCLATTFLNALALALRIPKEEKLLFSVPGYREAMGGKPRFLPLPRSLFGRCPWKRLG